jgi:16S rRNA (guanine966-N2)-methyltransferase
MGDRVRGALFNTLGDISGLEILDAFAGSGALSFEAVSRGATRAIAIESDRSAQKAIEQSINMLSVGNRMKLIKASAHAWLSTNPEVRFDIILCDPPYDNLQPGLLIKLAERAKPAGVVVVSVPPDYQVNLPPRDFQMLATKSYGDAQLLFFERRYVKDS